VTRRRRPVYGRPVAAGFHGRHLRVSCVSPRPAAHFGMFTTLRGAGSPPRAIAI